MNPVRQHDQGREGGVDVGVSVENGLVCLTGPLIGQWSGQTGLDNNVHFIDTGPNELRIRDNSEPRATILEIYQSKSIHTIGPVTMEEN